jgi:dihydrofolate reductase
MPKIVFVVAVARNGVIGAAGALPWRLPSDLKRFRETTWGKPMIMGRKTFQSIGKPLPGRETIVVTRDPAFSAEGVHVARSIEQAYSLAQVRAGAMDADEIMIVGGAEVYAAFAGLADRIVLTEVALEPAGDAVFPPLDPDLWREVSREAPPRGPKDEADFVIKVYERRSDRETTR